MKKVSAFILVGFIVVAVAFIIVGGSFDRQFWITFLAGLMENLTILALAVFVIESIFKRERWNKLEQTNAKQSQWIYFSAIGCRTS